MKALVKQVSAGSLRSTKRSSKHVAASDVGLSIETHASSGQLFSAELGGVGLLQRLHKVATPALRCGAG